jgi:hypothetical protein
MARIGEVRQSFPAPDWDCSPAAFSPRVTGMALQTRWLMIFLLPMITLQGWGQSDDFNDGNDSGWTRLDAIGQVLGSPFAGYQVQSGLYRLSCDPTPDPQLGPARLASYRADRIYSSFVVVVDVVSWDNTLDQALGILARVQAAPGPGAVNGYSLNYQPGDFDIEINRLEDEVPTNLVRLGLNLPPGESYRFVFCGQGDQLQAAVFNLAEPLLPLVVLAATDGTYEAGFCGLFAFDASSQGDGAVSATFDSYSAGPGMAPRLAFRRMAGDFTVHWPRLSGAWHLRSSADLLTWEPVTMGGMVSGTELSYTAPFSGARFYRLGEGWGVP